MNSIELLLGIQVYTIMQYKNLKCKILKCEANMYLNQQ
jgi:hypothetical protein